MKKLYEGKYIRLLERDGWEYVERTNASGAVIIIPVTDDGSLVLLKEWRVPLQKYVISWPAGITGDKGPEGIFEATNRELYEESGYKAGRLQVLLKCPSSVGLSNEMLTFVLADKLDKVGEGGGDDSEDISVHVVPRHKLEKFLNDMASDGHHIDLKVFVGLYFLSRR